MKRVATFLLAIVLAGCSDLAQTAEQAPSRPEPRYASLAAAHLRAVLKDLTPYGGFEISGLRWVHALRGWTWLACVHFADRGHQRSYAIFIQNSVVVDARYAVQTDACATQAYIPFDVVTGVLGQPTVPRQQPLY